MIATPYFKKHLKGLKFLGIDIVPGKRTLCYQLFYNTYAHSFVISMYVYTILEFIQVFFHSTDFNSITFGLAYFVTHILGLTKVAILVIKRKDIWKMLVRLEEGYFHPNMARAGGEEFSLIKNKITRSNYHADFFCIFVYSIIAIRCLYALFDNGEDETYFDDVTNSTATKHIRTLPYNTWLPADTHKSPLYEILFCIQAYYIIAYGVYIAFADSMIYGMIMHMSVHYSIIKIILENYVEMAKKRVLEMNPNSPTEIVNLIRFSLTEKLEYVSLTEPVHREIQHIVHYCSKYHLDIITYCEDIEDQFAYLMLMQFLSSLYIVCFSLFQLSLMKDILSFNFISMCLYLILMMYQIFWYCWYGNEVSVQSSELSTNVYTSHWTMTDESTKKSLLLIMMRAQRPTLFTAGKFAFLTLQTFVTIIRGSASYFMVLKQMND